MTGIEVYDAVSTWCLSLFNSASVSDKFGNVIDLSQSDKYQWSDNVGAFLEVLAYSEGTKGRGAGDGYDVLFGGGLFYDYSTHPNVHVPFRNTFSTAAGRYQINHGTWLGACPKLGITDFSPLSQDRIAVYLLKLCGALSYIDNGDIINAFRKASGTWASLPYSTAGQPTKSADVLASVYTQNGGFIA